MRVVLFTDTLGDLNGVSRFISDMAEQARECGDTLHVITSTAKRCPKAENIHNFKPRLRIKMPYYNELDLAFPPTKEIEDFVEFLDPEIIHISTPGPVGRLGRKLAQRYGVPILGTYHTDFPAYVRDNTGSKSLKRVTERIMKKFYAPFSHVFSRSVEYERIMRDEIGIDQSKITTIPPGTNLQRFSPLHHKQMFWLEHGLQSESIKVLYVGRITVEKNISFLLEMWEHLREHYPNINAELVLVGEGNLKSKAQQMKPLGVHYLGPIYTDELSSIYASADIFVFPSVTDTLGQVIMEAQASGVPALVSNVGGPKTLINTHQEDGFVIEGEEVQKWADVLVHLIKNISLRQEYSDAAHQNMKAFDIKRSYEHFWSIHKRYYPM